MFHEEHVERVCLFVIRMLEMANTGPVILNPWCVYETETKDGWQVQELLAVRCVF